jgi:hypothetical protein
MSQINKIIITIIIVIIGISIYWYFAIKQSEVSSLQNSVDEIETIDNSSTSSNEGNLNKKENNSSSITDPCIDLGEFLMSDGKCYAPGEVIPETDCTVSSTGECEVLGSEELSQNEDKCTTQNNELGFIMFDGKCYAPGEVVFDSGCRVTLIGTCQSY